jgi:hypothetical protein
MYTPHSISTIPQPHSAKTLAPDLLNMVNCLNQMRHKFLWVLRSREMAQVWHSLVHSTRDLVCSLLRHFWSIGPVVLACEHVYWASLCVDRCYTRPTIPATEIEVEVSVKSNQG